MTSYRPVIADDIPAVARINVDVWRTTYRDIVPAEFLSGLDYRQAEERWERFLQRPASIAIAAELEGSVIGYLMAGRERSGNERYPGEIYALYLRDEHQRRGIGRGLIEATREAIGPASLLLTAAPDAVSFYEHIAMPRVTDAFRYAPRG